MNPLWLTWLGDRTHQQLLQLGFIVYNQMVGSLSLQPLLRCPFLLTSCPLTFGQTRAEEMTIGRQTGSRSQRPRAHQFLEVRNFMCAYIKRNDPSSRRLIQLMSLESSRLLVLARDVKTGKVVAKPPSNELWLVSGRRRLFASDGIP